MIEVSVYTLEGSQKVLSSKYRVVIIRPQNFRAGEEPEGALACLTEDANGFFWR
jgi:hypothetical protein